MKLFNFGREDDDFPGGKKEKKKEKKDDPASKNKEDNELRDIIEDDIRDIGDNIRNTEDDRVEDLKIEEDGNMNIDNNPEDINDDEDGRDNSTNDEYSDYIDPDDLDYEDYDDIIDYIEGDFTLVSSSGLYPISHLDTDIVITHPVNKNENGTVLEITCPDNSIIAICGFHQRDTDENFAKGPNLYTRPHFFTLRCTDENDKEISSMNIVSISKVNRKGVLERFYQEFYGDISPWIDGRLKKKHERYYFAETIILQGKEKLIFQIKPNIDISNIELLMMADLFNRDE